MQNKYRVIHSVHECVFNFIVSRELVVALAVAQFIGRGSIYNLHYTLVAIIFRATIPCHHIDLLA